MNAGRLIIAQLLRKPLQTVLAVLLALGIATLVFVVLVQGQLSRQLTRDAQGIDLVVGAKGSPLQLILSAVYHIDIPTGNVPVAAMEQLRANRLIAQVIPVSLGDNFRGFRIVGTEPALIEHYGGRQLPARSGPRRCKRYSAPKSLSAPDSRSDQRFPGPMASPRVEPRTKSPLQRGRHLDADRDGARSACDHR